MNEDIKSNLKLNISISKIKREKERNMIKTKSKIYTCFISLICILIATTGIVVAANFENLKEYFSNSRGLGKRNRYC